MKNEREKEMDWNEPDAEHPEEFGTVQPEGLQDDGTPQPEASAALGERDA